MPHLPSTLYPKIHHSPKPPETLKILLIDKREKQRSLLATRPGSLRLMLYLFPYPTLLFPILHPLSLYVV